MGIFGPPDIDKMKENKKVSGLIKALNYKKDNNIRQAAAEALGDIGDPQAVEPLIATLQDTDLDMQNVNVILLALGKIGGARAIKELITAFEDEKYRSRATEALIKIGKPAVVPLIAILKDAKNLKLIAATRAVLYKIGEPAVEPLVATLNNDKDERLDPKVINILGDLADPRAVEPLIAVLNNEDKYMRSRTADALGLIGDPRAVEPLIAILRDEKESLVRESAAEALGAIGDPRAVEPLQTAVLKVESESERKVAYIALEQLNSPPDQGEAGLLYWIFKERWDKAADYGSLAVEPLIGALEYYLKRGNKEVQRSIINALRKIGEPAVEPLIARLKDEDFGERNVIVFALGQLGNLRSIDSLVAVLKGKNDEVRLSVADTLDLMKWKPDSREDEAWYLLAKGRFEEAHKLGEPSIKDALLLRSAWENNILIVQKLLESGANPNYQNHKGETPLHHAIYYSTQILELMLEAGGEINKQNNHGYTPLHGLVIDDSFIDKVKVLITKGANVNMQNKFGEAPLHSAAIHKRNTRVIELLVASGADVNLKNNDGNTPLQQAISYDSAGNVSILRNIGVQNTTSQNLKNYDEEQLDKYKGEKSSYRCPMCKCNYIIVPQQQYSHEQRVRCPECGQKTTII